MALGKAHASQHRDFSGVLVTRTPERQYRLCKRQEVSSQSDQCKLFETPNNDITWSPGAAGQVRPLILSRIDRSERPLPDSISDVRAKSPSGRLGIDAAALGQLPANGLSKESLVGLTVHAANQFRNQ
jgi:hypothetical protein